MRHIDLRRIPRGVATPLSIIILLALAGCQQNEVRSYSVPKEEVAPAAQAVAPHGGASEIVTWTLPAGWEERPGSGLRFATLIVDGGSGETGVLELRVTPLALMARDPHSNVNRWREQIGLAPVPADALDSMMRTIEVDGRPVQLVSIESEAREATPAQQILAAILAGDERAWFFMIMDEAARVGPHQAAFEEFIRTVRLGRRSPHGMPPSMPPSVPPASAGGMSEDAIAPPPADGESVTWELPDGWRQQATSSRMRVATFTVERDGGSAEITITRFPGDVGGTLPNVNRWRGQVGLAPIADLSEQETARIEIDGQPGGLIDLAGPTPSGSADDDAPRMLVAQVRRPDMTWFFKISGPAGLLEAERDDFTHFVRSIRFHGAARD
jgi:hypothetical protein